MNAYELADAIEEDMEEGFGMGFLQDAVNMIRQQAQAIAMLSDRIAELEKELYFKNYYEELPDTPVGIIGKIGDSPIHDLVHRTKNENDK
jgi:hypothetical protein